MSMYEDPSSRHRVKFVDMRIGSQKRRKNSGARAPKPCAKPGCDAPATCKGPSGHHKFNDSMFCSKHAAERNRAHNFFDSMTQSEFESFMQAEQAGHKKTWRFGKGPVSGAARAEHYWRGRDPLGEKSTARTRESNRSRLQLRCLEALGLDSKASVSQVRERYAFLIKAYHPDSNGGDRSTEPEMARVIKAFKTLKAAGLA